MSFSAGQMPSALQLNYGLGLQAVKLANETVNNSAVFQNDNELFVSVEAGRDYLCHLHLVYNSGTTPDFKYQFTYPTLASLINWSYIGYNTAVSFVYGVNGEAQSLGGNGSNLPLDAWGILRTGANAGTLQLQWAQNTANASDTVVANGSFLSLIPASP